MRIIGRDFARSPADPGDALVEVTGWVCPEEANTHENTFATAGLVRDTALIGT